MAGESVRWKILDAVNAALEGITVALGFKTNVAYVSPILDFTHPEKQDKNKFPGCYTVDLDEAIFSFEIGTGSNVELRSDLELVITCMLYDRQASDLLLARTNLMRDVNKAITQDATLEGLLLERPTLNGIITDKGFYGVNYSVWDHSFTATYLFTEEDGG